MASHRLSFWAFRLPPRRRRASAGDSNRDATCPWQRCATSATLHGMDTAPRANDSAEAARPENATAKQRRLAWEAAMIAEADADIAAGRLVDEAKVDAWIDSIGTDHELPPPRSGR